MIMNSVHFIMDFYGFKEISFSQLKTNKISLLVRYYGLSVRYYDLSFFFFFLTRNSGKVNDLSKITELLSGETVTYLGLLISDLVFFYT